jgi:putative aminopeptidase FrvX
MLGVNERDGDRFRTWIHDLAGDGIEDGAVFTRYGSVDIPLGWPLRYSHSPGEVIDTRDLDALSKIITTLAREW